jgi:O-antigen/teichoic acid export membrane protein
MEEQQDKNYSRISGQVIFSNSLLLFTILISPALLALLTRVLSVEDYGVYSLLSAFVSLLALGLVFGMSNFILARLPGQAKEVQAKKFWKIVFFDVIVVLLILLSLYFTPFKAWFLNFTNLTAYSTEFGICLLLIFFLSMTKLFFEFFSARKQMNFVNTMDFLVSKGWMLLLFGLFFLFKSFTLSHVLLIWLAGVVLSVLIYFIRSFSDLKLFFHERFSSPVVKKALYFGLPLVPVVIAGWFISISDRFLINYFMSASAVGLYTLPYSLLGTIKTVSASASVVIMPYFAEARNTGKDSVKLISASLKFGFLIAIPCLVGGFILREPVILLISGEKYLSSVPVLIPLLLFPLFYFVSSVFCSGLLVAGETKHIAGAYGLAAISNIGLNWVLIPRFELIGAAVATTVSYFIMVTYMHIIFRRHCKIDYAFVKIPKILLSGLVMGLVIYFIPVSSHIWTFISIAIGGAVYGIMLLVLKVLSKKEIKMVFSKIPLVRNIVNSFVDRLL